MPFSCATKCHRTNPSCLDDMIELNNRTNKVLEEMAQAIFKQWFIDFEFPNENGESYKSSGGEMVDSELGEIPKGWNVGIINDLVECTISGDWGKEKAEGNYTQQVVCIRGADIPEVSKGTSGNAPHRFILSKNCLKKSLSSNELIVEISGGSPTQSTGRSALITTDFMDAYPVPIICTNFCRAIRLKNPIYSHFTNMLWKYLYLKDVFFGYENGTTGIKKLGSYGSTHERTGCNTLIETAGTYFAVAGMYSKIICHNAKETNI